MSDKIGIQILGSNLSLKILDNHVCNSIFNAIYSL